jgi:hypothetical protein
MTIFFATLALITGAYFLYLGFKFFNIGDNEYKKYRKGLSGSIKNTFYGENNIDREGAVNGVSRDSHTGEIYKKASYSPEHTKRLFS